MFTAPFVSQRSGARSADELESQFSADIETAAMAETSHRPWPLPRRPWQLRQRWRDLLFVHWPIEERLLRPWIPTRLRIERFAGTAWIGVVPFEIPEFGWRRSRFSLAFPEINLRTYVVAQGKPGVWFLSLDAASLAAVLGARAAYRLPYFSASMRMSREDGRVRFESTRRFRPGVAFDATYRATGPAYVAEPGTLDYFLTERYCLYTRWHDGRVRRLPVHHPPWKLQSAELELRTNSMGTPFGFDCAGPPVVHFSAEQDVLTWGLESLRGGFSL